MVIGMATKKITITLEAEQVGAIRALVAERKAASISGFVKHAVHVALDDVAGWGALLAVSLEESGGPLTRKERVWADAVLDHAASKTKPRRRRRAA
jgi:Arc/MetJ-type ribon-helix-helix transcriptional regulator